MNLSTLTLTQLKAAAAKYALQVDGDKRLRSTWEQAIESAGEFIAAQVDAVKDAAIELAQETFTYQNAVLAANTVNVWTRKSLKFTLKAVWSVFLVSIALVMLAIEAYKNRQQIGLTIRTDAKARINLWKYQSRYQYAFLRTHGHSVFRRNVVKPVLSRRDQIRETMKSALLK